MESECGMNKIDLSNLRITVSNVGQDIIHRGLERACMIVEEAAKNNCPKDIGVLANSIQSEVDGNVGYVYSDEPYAIYVELGTGIFASDNEGAMTGTGRQTPWHYFYTGKKLSSEEQAYIAENGYQVFQGKQGI